MGPFQAIAEQTLAEIFSAEAVLGSFDALREDAEGTKQCAVTASEISMSPNPLERIKVRFPRGVAQSDAPKIRICRSSASSVGDMAGSALTGKDPPKW